MSVHLSRFNRIKAILLFATPVLRVILGSLVFESGSKSKAPIRVIVSETHIVVCYHQRQVSLSNGVICLQQFIKLHMVPNYMIPSRRTKPNKNRG